MNEIVQKEDKVLRKIAKEVPKKEISGKKIQTVIKKMIKALDGQDDGVAIAAPQIAENWRIFVISKKIFEIMPARHASQGDAGGEEESKRKEYKDMVFINPEILKTSKEKSVFEEGCLSVRWLYGKVRRAQKTLVKALDENGKPFTMGGSGLLSQAFQHEIDHLNGVLFIDKATNLKEIEPEIQ